MLPPPRYRPGTYPPGPKWPQWGDPQLDKAFVGLSEEAHAHLLHKSDDMREIHKQRLEKQGLTPIAFPKPQHYSMIEPPAEEFYEAEDGEPRQGVFEEQAISNPSTTETLVKGAKHLIKEYAWPATPIYWYLHLEMQRSKRRKGLFGC